MCLHFVSHSVFANSLPQGIVTKFVMLCKMAVTATATRNRLITLPREIAIDIFRVLEYKGVSS